MRFRLRTLLIVLALGPPLLAGGWREYRAYLRRAIHAPMTSETINAGDILVTNGQSNFSDDGTLILIPPK
jgi:hypothetical protein